MNPEYIKQQLYQESWSPPESRDQAQPAPCGFLYAPISHMPPCCTCNTVASEWLVFPGAPLSPEL